MVDLDVARLVRHLVGGVPLGLLPGNALHDLGGGEERALLAVQELGEHPGGDVEVELHRHLGLELVGRVQELVEDLARPGAEHVARLLREVDLGLPGEVARVPAARLALLVEREEVLASERVLPVEDGVHADREALARADVGDGERIVLDVVHVASGGGAVARSRRRVTGGAAWRGPRLSRSASSAAEPRQARGARLRARASTALLNSSTESRSAFCSSGARRKPGTQKPISIVCVQVALVRLPAGSNT